jgi:RNA polymerase sigma-70 factor, ECF subfamily
MNQPTTEYETSLLEQARAFNQAALVIIYDEYHPLLFHYIAGRVGDGETARDLTADVFDRFLHALQDGQGPAQFLRAWLYRAAHNAVVDHYRRQKHRQHDALPDNLVDGDCNPAQKAEQHLLAEEARAALSKLTEDQQQVIALKFYAGLSNEEVANILDKPIGAVKSLQHRGLAALQRQLLPMSEERFNV